MVAAEMGEVKLLGTPRGNCGNGSSHLVYGSVPIPQGMNLRILFRTSINGQCKIPNLVISASTIYLDVLLNKLFFWRHLYLFPVFWHTKISYSYCSISHEISLLYPVSSKKNCTHPTSHDFTSASEPQHMFVFLLLQVLDAVSRRSDRKNVAWLPSGKPT